MMERAQENFSQRKNPVIEDKAGMKMLISNAEVIIEYKTYVGWRI